MIEILINALKKGKKDVPKHVALMAIDRKLVKTKMTPDRFFTLRFQSMLQLIDTQIKYAIPTLSFFVSKLHDSQEYRTEFTDVMTKFFSDLSKNEKVTKQCRIRILGHTETLSEQMRQVITTITQQTEKNETYTVNFFIAYDGKEEVLAACRKIVKPANGNAADLLTQETIEKDILSVATPPELLVVVDGVKELHGFFLWTATQAKIYFSDKNMTEFSQNDLLKAIAHWQKWKK